MNTAASHDDDVYGVNIRWRTNYKYDWLFFEVWPTLGFPEEYDYDPSVGILLRVEAFFGARTPKGPVKLSD